MMSIPLMLFLQAATSTSPTPVPATSGASVTLPVCLARPFQDAKGATHSLTVAVRPDTAPALLAGGFTVAACSAVRRTAPEYRSDVCALASSGNSAVQARLEAIYGVAPALLCSEATTLGSLLATVLQPAG